MTRRRLTAGNILLLAALIIGLVSVFQPWDTLTFFCGTYETEKFGCSRVARTYLSGNRPILGWWLLYAFLILNLAGFFVIRTVAPSRLALPKLPIADWLIYLMAGVVLLAIGLLHIRDLPPRDDVFGEYYGIAYGWYVAIAAAAAICAAALRKRFERQLQAIGCAWAAVGLVLGVLFLEVFVAAFIAFLFAPKIM